MSASIVSTQEVRHLLVRLPEGGRITEALSAVLKDQIVLAGWIRATGAVADAELRVVDARSGSLGPVRRIDGHVQLVALEGAIGIEGDDPTFGARVLVARETPLGVETFAGELVDARVVAVEVLVTALDQISASRAAAPSGLTLLATATLTPAAATSSPALTPPAPAPAPAPARAPAPASPTWAEAAQASEAAARPAPAPAPAPRAAPPAAAGYVPVAMPAKPLRPATTDDDQVYPEPGDTVEHFAFGRCEVLKSDGDRLHVRAKDGRIKEIALEMLKVTTLPTPEGQTKNHYKLDRKL